MAPSKLTPIKNILEKSGSPLASLSGKAARLEAMTAAIRKALPEPLDQHLLAASEAGDTLVLTADSPAWAARMRFHEREILTHHAREQGRVSQKLVVRVRRSPA